MPLSDRSQGPVSGAASSANQASLNVQAALSGPLPALQAVTTSSEVKILNPENLATALTVTWSPDTAAEQAVLDLFISGRIVTTASGTIALGVYADGLPTVTAGNLLHKTASATTQNSTGAPFFIHQRLIYDSVSGKLHGDAEQLINNVKDPQIANSNVPTGISNTANPVFTLSLTITSSGAASGTPTTINVQKFSVG